MKILIAIDHFKNGGAERVASIIINKLARNHNLHVVVLESDINYPLDLDKFKLHQICYNHNTNFAKKQYEKLYSLREVVKTVRPDVLLAFGYYMSVISYFSLIMNGRSKIKFITSERTDPTREPSNKLYAMLRNYVYAHSELLVCQTEWVKSYFSSRINVPIEIIPNPISPDLPDWKGIGSQIILTACRFVSQKNLPLLINAFEIVHRHYPDFKLRILGDGDERENLMKLIETLNLSNCVEMPGFSKNIYQEMINSYMYISSSDYEGISNSMLEALGCGMPTICTDCPVGGASMFIKNNMNGLLVPARDVDALAKAMIDFISNKDFALQCGTKAKEIVYSIDANSIAQMWSRYLMK